MQVRQIIPMEKKEKDYQHEVYSELVCLLISIYVYKIVSSISRMNMIVVVYIQ